MLERNTNQVLLAIFLDLALTLAAVGLTIVLRAVLPFGQTIDPAALAQIQVLYWEAALVYLVVFALLSVYDPDRPPDSGAGLLLVFRASLLAGLTLAGTVYFTYRDVSRLSLVYFFILHFSFVAGWRGLLSVWQARRKGHDRRVLLVGGGPAARRALDQLDRLHLAGSEVAGYLADEVLEADEPLRYPRLGRMADVPRTAAELGISDLVIAVPAESYAQLQDLVRTWIDLPCSIWLVPDYSGIQLYGARIQDLGGIPLISLKSPTLSGYQRLLKRFIDLALGSAALILSLPLMTLVALAIRLDSAGPVVLRQRRVGENGKIFDMLKFRSMRSGSELEPAEPLETAEDEEGVHKRAADPRVTRLGRFLRRTSMDETPQLINVLKGEMSLVGPRPELPQLVEKYAAWQHQRFAVPQGLTGWWQVNGRSDRPMHLHTEDDLFYIQNYSIWLDLRILIRTAWAVLIGKGAF